MRGKQGEKMNKTLCAVALLTALLGGCATIVGDKTQLMSIASTPSDATVLITDEKGVQVFKGTTPTSVTLQKSDGTYWGKKSFTVEITKEGYEKRVIPITASANGWYIAGNIVFGGLIGWFIVDPLNGAMYTLSTEQINATLGEKTSKNSTSLNDGISIVLLQDVPESLRGQMKRIN
ncbi:hypothetical protein GCM10007169_29770 [Shewanella fodinae]|nr:hypothetical protein GCM10007169_29770 [Shewanella fodinae]